MASHVSTVSASSFFPSFHTFLRAVLAALATLAALPSVSFAAAGFSCAPLAVVFHKPVAVGGVPSQATLALRTPAQFFEFVETSVDVSAATSAHAQTWTYAPLDTGAAGAFDAFTIQMDKPSGSCGRGACDLPKPPQATLKKDGVVSTATCEWL